MVPVSLVPALLLLLSSSSSSKNNADHGWEPVCRAQVQFFVKPRLSLIVIGYELPKSVNLTARVQKLAESSGLLN
jgi:hypothetical protein